MDFPGRQYVGIYDNLLDLLKIFHWRMDFPARQYVGIYDNLLDLF